MHILLPVFIKVPHTCACALCPCPPNLVLPPLPQEFPRAELQAKVQRAAGQGALKGRPVLSGRSRDSSSGIGMLQVPLAEQCPYQGQHPRHARGLEGVWAVCSCLPGSPWSSPFNNCTDRLTEAENGGQKCSWVLYLCAQWGGPAHSGVGQPGLASGLLHL